MKTCTVFIYGDIHYMTNSFYKNGLKIATPSLACELHFLNKFFLSTSSLVNFIAHDVHTNVQVKSLCIIKGIFIHSSFFVMNFVLPACRPKFSAVTRNI
jgi:hypothetical protein